MTTAPRPPGDRLLFATGAVALAFFALHTAEVLVTRVPWDTIWMCHMACALIGIGCFARSGMLAGMGLSWVAYGTPLWVLDLATGGTLVPSSLGTHLGGLAVGVVAVSRLGFPSGTWLRALAGLFALVMATRFTTAPEHNVNLAHRVQAGYERFFASYPPYFAFLLALSGAAFLVVERIARAVLARMATRADPRGEPVTNDGG